MTDRKPPFPPRRPLPAASDFESFRPRSERPDQVSPPPMMRPIARPGQPGRPRPPAQQHSVRHETAPASRSSLLRGLIWAGLGITGLAAVGVAALLVWSPTGVVREQLIQRVKAKTGRDLVIAGPTTLSLFPNLAIAMADVSLSPPVGMKGQPTITMQSLAVSVPLVALLQGRVEAEQIVLQSPVINLLVDAQGRRSWDLAGLAPLRPVQVAQAPSGAGRLATGQMPKELQDFVKQSNPNSREAMVSRGLLGTLENLSLSDIQIIGGTVRYADQRNGTSEELRSIDARMALASINAPFDAKGSLIWRAEPVSFETRLSSPKQLLEERPTRLSIKVAGRPIDLTWEGNVTLGRGAELEGSLVAKSASLKALAGLLGVASGASNLGTGNVVGLLKASESSVSLTDATLVLDGVSARGSITVEPRGKRPMVRGNIQISELDLNRYALPTAATPAAVVPPVLPRPPAGAQRAPGAKPAQSIEDLLRETEPGPATRVRGFTKRAGWSDEPIDLAAFGWVDADLKLGLGSLIYHDIKVGQTQMRVVLKDRALTAHFDDVQLYEGRGRGLLTVDGTDAQAAFGANLSIEGASALPLLKDAASFDWISGRGKVSLALGGRGITERQIVATLQGKADITFKDGAVVGYNVPAILNGLMQGRFIGLERSAAEKTDFSEMAASFTIVNGVATNKDLRLVSPLIRITGAGSANLPERTLDYTLRPKLVAGGGGQGAPADASGIEIPVRLSGSWDRPAIAPDFDAVLKNPDQAIDAAKQIGRQLKSGDGTAINKAKELLNQFLKR